MTTVKRTIGNIASAADVNVETIRFYERKNLIQQPDKDGGFRYYSENDLAKVKFIKRAQGLGFSLSEISELLALELSDHGTCSDILSKVESKIQDIQIKISDLTQILTSLETLKECCHDRNTPMTDVSLLDVFKEVK